MEPRISVVVATRNRRPELLRTLERLSALPERPRIVVADNGSTDGTANAVAERFPRAMLLPLGHDHGPAARLLSVARCRTEAVAFCDDDSWWAPGALARAVAVLERHPTIGLIAAHVLVGEDQRPDPTSVLMADSPLPRAGGVPGVPVLGFVACGAIVRRSAFLEAHGFEITSGFGGEEELLAVDMASNGWDIVYLDDVVAHHHPSHIRDPAVRSWTVLSNTLLTAWLRRPRRRAAAVTRATARQALRDRAARRALAVLLRNAYRVARNRREITPELERRLSLVERVR
jgi:GT2 family glycosyltransferase